MVLTCGSKEVEGVLEYASPVKGCEADEDGALPAAVYREAPANCVNQRVVKRFKCHTSIGVNVL